MEVSSQQQTGSILVVDDNPLIIGVLSGLLSGVGYTTYTATNGEEALNLISGKEIDLVICDVMMPKMDGYAFQEAIRLRPEFCHIPFIFLTALDEGSEVDRGIESGADDYLTKPFDPRYVLSLVRGKIERGRILKAQVDERFDIYRKRIIHTLSHEFRTPLVAISTGTEILLDSDRSLDSGRVAALLEAIRRGGERLERLVNDFMFLQQIEAGVAERLFQQNRKPVKVKTLTDYAINAAQSIVTESKHQLHVDDRASDSVVLVYDAQIADILVRLISNACKFSNAGSKVELATYRQAKEVIIEIRDDGIGIDLDKVREAVDPFGQLDREKLEQQGGGLGLAIANRYAQINHGRIEFDRRATQGSVVSLILQVV